MSEELTKAELRKGCIEMVQYLLCDEISKDQEIVDSYVETFMFVSEEYSKAKIEELEKSSKETIWTYMESVNKLQKEVERLEIFTKHTVNIIRTMGLDHNQKDSSLFTIMHRGEELLKTKEQ